MNTNKNQPQFEMVNSLQSMMVSAHEATNIVSKAVEDLVKTQFGVSNGNITENIPSYAPSFLPEGPTRLFLQVSNLYQTQSQRMVQVMLDSFSILSHAQQQLLELQRQSLSLRAQNATNTMSLYIDALVSRRVTEKVIRFADRRLTEQVVVDAVASISNDAAKRQVNPRESRQVAA